MRAALQADAVSFKNNVKPLVEEHSTHDNGVGHIFMGTFYLVAPWPIRNLGKAKVKLYHGRVGAGGAGCSCSIVACPVV